MQMHDAGLRFEAPLGIFSKRPKYFQNFFEVLLQFLFKII